MCYLYGKYSFKLSRQQLRHEDTHARELMLSTVNILTFNKASQYYALKLHGIKLISDISRIIIGYVLLYDFSRMSGAFPTHVVLQPSSRARDPHVGNQ
jgi:hypothetical protein